MDCKWNWRESYLCLSQIQTFPNLPHGERFPGKDFNGRGCLQKLDSGQVQGSKGVGKYDCIPGQCQQSTVQVIWSDIECSKSGFHHTKWSVWFHLCSHNFLLGRPSDIQLLDFGELMIWSRVRDYVILNRVTEDDSQRSSQISPISRSLASAVIMSPSLTVSTASTGHQMTLDRQM